MVLDQQEPKQIIALCMIVKDESKVIERALGCVSGFVDKYFICDTGSSDNTIEVIENYFKEHNLAGEVHSRPWVNFSHNRQESFDMAKGKCDYIMTLDADEVFAMYEGDVPILSRRVTALPTFFADRIETKTVYGGVVYNRGQFFKESINWKWSWPVHEVCGSIDEKSVQLIENACVYPLTDGARSRDPDRYLRDALVFENWLLDHPKDTRAWFYLAQSYRDGGQSKKAISPLMKCLELSGWDEEIFLCHLRLARYKLESGESFESVIHHYLDAQNCRPTRAEPFCDMLSYYRSQNKYNLGVLMGEKAASIPFPRGDRLFVEGSVYTWRVKDDLAVCYYWVGRYQEGYDLGLELLNGPHLPKDQKERVERNVQYCKEKLDEEN